MSSTARSLVGLLGNSLIITALNLSINSMVVPPATAWLARIKYGLRGTPPVDSPHLLGFLRAQANSSLFIEVVAVVLAPMVFVFALDELCLRYWACLLGLTAKGRYYLAFDPDLRGLLEAWGIGVTGFDAYRVGFCSRQLLSGFAYVTPAHWPA